MRRAHVIGTLLTGAILAGCGADGQQSPSTAAEGRFESGVVEVIAEDIKFPESSYTATAGRVDVHYRNDGSITHTLVIQDVDGFKLEVAGNGDEDEGTVDLEAGTYTLYCDVAGHRAAGMEATLEVG